MNKKGRIANMASLKLEHVKKVYDKIQSYRKQHGADPKVIFLQNHGIFVGADTTEEIDEIYDGIMSKLETIVKPLPEGDAPVCDCVSETVPAIRTQFPPSVRS